MTPADRAPLDVPDEALRAFTRAYNDFLDQTLSSRRDPYNAKMAYTAGLRAALPLTPQYQAPLEVAKEAERECTLALNLSRLWEAISHPLVQKALHPGQGNT